MGLFEFPKEIDGKFGDWINYASERHQACVTAEPTSEDQQVLKDIELAVAGASIDYQQNISTSQLEKSLEAATEAFRSALDSVCRVRPLSIHRTAG